MRPRPRVVAFGQAAAGDDGVGPAVLEELRRRGAGAHAELRALADATELIGLVQREGVVVIVDAVLASPPGAVMEIAPHLLSDRRPRRPSSHALTVPQALDLAAVLAAGEARCQVHIVAVGIDEPRRHVAELSSAVAAAVPAAATRVLEILERVGAGETPDPGNPAC